LPGQGRGAGRFGSSWSLSGGPGTPPGALVKTGEPGGKKKKQPRGGGGQCFGPAGPGRGERGSWLQKRLSGRPAGGQGGGKPPRKPPTKHVKRYPKNKDRFHNFGAFFIRQSQKPEGGGGGNGGGGGGGVPEAKGRKFKTGPWGKKGETGGPGLWERRGGKIKKKPPQGQTKNAGVLGAGGGLWGGGWGGLLLSRGNRGLACKNGFRRSQPRQVHHRPNTTQKSPSGGNRGKGGSNPRGGTEKGGGCGPKGEGGGGGGGKTPTRGEAGRWGSFPQTWNNGPKKGRPSKGRGGRGLFGGRTRPAKSSLLFFFLHFTVLLALVGEEGR